VSCLINYFRMHTPNSLVDSKLGALRLYKLL
jgi:hypothetical protein